MEPARRVTEAGEGSGIIDAGCGCLCHEYSESPSFHPATAGFIAVTSSTKTRGETRLGGVCDHEAHKLTHLVSVPGGVLLLLVT